MIAPVISPAILFTAGLFASPVIISDVALTEEGERLRVTIQATGGIDPEAAQTAVLDGRLLLQLGGTRVKADRRSWPLAGGDEEIRAHRHSEYTELVVPLAASHCTGPVELSPSSDGLTAYVGCDRARATRRKAAPAKAPVEVANEAAPEKSRAAEASVAKAGTAAADSRGKLEALVALGDAPEQPGTALPEKKGTAPAPLPAAPGVPTSQAPASATRATGDSAATIGSQTAAAPALAAGGSEKDEPASLEEARAARDGGSKGLGVTVIPAILLAALAVAAYWFARRRRVLVPRTIEIVETASLGPKRALVVAKVGDETLILGSSEAGITLLKVAGHTGEGAPGASGGSAVGGVHDAEQSLTEALADIPEPEVTDPIAMPGRSAFRSIDGGAAGPRLAHSAGGARRDTSLGPDSGGLRGEQRLRAEDAKVELRSGEPRDRLERLGDEDLTVSGDSAAFQDLLEDSFEDQELRQKLAAGLAARVR
jgi:flagellar biogenesis protein FliO